MSTKLSHKIIRWLNISQFWLLPGICVVCKLPTGRPRDLCLACQMKLPRITDPCPGCALPLPPGELRQRLCGQCSRTRPIFRTVAPLRWEGEVIPLVTGFKYRQQLVAGRVLGQVLESHIRNHYGSDTLPELLLPVPLHASRLRERGYNQALLLARQLGDAFNLPVSHDLLNRVRNTPAQQGLNARQRKLNLKGAFSVPATTPLQGIGSIAIVDDVVTTMTTVRMAALALHQASPLPLRIHVWALARA